MDDDRNADLRHHGVRGLQQRRQREESGESDDGSPQRALGGGVVDKNDVFVLRKKACLYGRLGG